MSRSSAGDKSSPLGQTQALGRQLIDWFAVHRRPLPWREDRDPYRVWISEIMLQQTRVDTVIPYYERFLAAFPTVDALAAASETDVLKLWEGLGYYSRARNLHRAAKEIVARFDGRLPPTVEELLTLPGIGRYTAGAIASIAFDQPVAAVDGNVLRVVARLLGITEVITKAAVQRRVAEQVVAMMPPGEAAAMTEALMELGALVCLPRNPLCARCPWRDDCLAQAQGIAEQLPVRPRRTPPRIVNGAVAVVHKALSPACLAFSSSGPEVPGFAGVVLIARRPEEGLLAGMWEFPWVEVDKASASKDVAKLAEFVCDMLRRRFGIEARVVGRLPSVRHVFSHLEWRLNVFVCEAVPDRAKESTSPEDGLVVDGAKVKWVSPVQLEQLPFGRAHRRIAEAFMQGKKNVR